MTPSGRALVAAGFCLLAACATPRPIDLPPAGDGPPLGARTGPWRGRGRLHLTWAGGSWSGGVLVRRRERDLALALLADGGVPLAGLVLGPEASRCEPADPELRERLAPLLLVLRAAWLAPAPDVRRVGSHLEAGDPTDRRLYAGDPPRLRRLSLPGGTARVEAYRGPPDDPVPHRIAGRSDGLDFVLRLDAVTLPE